MTLEELIQNEDFVSELISKETIDDAKDLFAKNGVNVNDEDIESLAKACDDMVDGNDELNADKLSEIDGGFYRGYRPLQPNRKLQEKIMKWFRR